MTIAIIMLICAGLALVGGLILRRYTGFSRKPVMTLVAIVLSLVGIVLSIISWNAVTAEWTTRHWPQTTAVVTSSTVVGQRAFHPDIEYRYTVDDSVYAGVTDLHVPAFGGKRKRFDVAEKEAALYKAGDSIMVHYNPQNPSESLIHIGPTYDSYLQLALGLTLLMGGVFLLPLIPKKRPE